MPKLRKSADKSLSQPGCNHSNTIYDVQLQKTIILRMQPRHRATLTQPLQALVAKHIEGTNRVRNDPSRNRRTDEVPFIAGCSHFTRKNTRFRAPASSPKHSPCNIHAATTMRSRPQLQETRRTTPQEQPLVAKHIEGTNRVRNDPGRNRRTDEVPFIAGCSHFTRKNTRFRAPASSPKHSPCNIHAATTMRSRPQLQETHRTTPQEQPLVAKHIEGTNRVRNDPTRNRRTDEVPFIAGCSHFTRKNTRFRAPASSPKHSPCNIHAAIPMRSATTASGNA